MFFSISQNTGSLPFTVCNIAFLMEGKKDFRCVWYPVWRNLPRSLITNTVICST